MYLYVIRHGLTEWNVEKKLLSYTDIPLNEIGIKQCQEAEKLVKNLDYDIVFCSPKLRTKMTLEIINSKNIPVIYDDRLVERDAGDLEGIDVNSFDYESYWTLGKDVLKNSENIIKCQNRVYELLDEIKNKYKDKNVLIVTHNGVCRMIYTYFNGYPRRKNISNKGQGNAEIKIYELK